MFNYKKYIPKRFKAKGSLIQNNKAIKRENLKLTSKHKDILKSLFELPVSGDWLSDEEINKIERDSTVTAAKGSRKAAILKKEIVITCKDETTKKRLEGIFDFDTLDSILDIPYQGFGVFEINWSLQDGEWIMYPYLQERPYKDFMLNNGVLQYAQNGIPEDIIEHKAIHAVYKSKPLKPYGQPLYTPLFWLIEFKNASLEFWVELLERFGTPWVIGKTDGSKEEFADEIYNMLGGDGAVLDTEDNLEIVTAKDQGNFKEIIEYIDNQIREVILGGNLTGQVTGGSLAAASVHNDIRTDLAQADENILNKMIIGIIDSFKTLNNITDEITGILKDKDDLNIELANRDKVISEMGYKPTQEYIETTYNIKVEKIEEPKQIITNSKLYQFSKDIPQDELELQSNNVDTKKSLTFQTQILEIIENSKSYEDMQDKLETIYPNTSIKDLQEILFNNIANSEILGRAEIENENGND